MYIVQQGGQIRTFDTTTNSLSSTSFLDLNSISGTNLIDYANGGGNEQGLLGLAFHPNFQNNGKFYAYYTSGPSTNSTLRIDQFTVSGGVVDPASRLNVLSISHPTNTNHNGGWIGFNPMNTAGGANQGQLYIGVGDGGSGDDPPNNAQNSNALLGKMLRVDVGNGLATANSYTIPVGNMTVNPNGPIAVNPSNLVRPEIYAYGIRNPWRNSFDRANGNLYIADVGQNTREEVNFIRNGTVNTSAAGLNFGWRLREGNIQNPNPSVGGPVPVDYRGPIIDYDHTSGVTPPFSGASITGGYVYRGPAFPDNGTDLNGTYFFTDYINGTIGSFRTDPVTGAVSEIRDRTSEILGNLPPGQTLSDVATFAEDGTGRLYLLDLGGGGIFRLEPVPEPALLLPLALSFVAVRRKLKG
jgi:hypothetical protein